MFITPPRVRLHIACSTILLTASLLTAQSAKAPTRTSLAGAYEGNQMEVAAQLLLKPDGHFQYELAYGALDEAAEGTWDIRDNAVLLTTVPAVKPPRFVVVSDTPAPNGALYVKLVKPLMEGARQRIYLIYGQNISPEMTEVADDGRVTFPDSRRPIGIVPEIPVYPTITEAIPLTGTGGHRITLRFEPNDIGKADFRALRLPIEDGALVMTRPDLELKLHFKRQSNN